MKQQLELFEDPGPAALFAWPGFTNIKTEVKKMDIEQLLIGLLEEVEHEKQSTENSAAKRFFAIMNTDLEKLYAFYMLYLSPLKSGGQL